MTTMMTEPLTRIRLCEDDIRAVIENAQSQNDYIVSIYRMVFPEWDDIEKIGGWPQCNKKTWAAICRIAMAWDEKNTECMAGGCWMNNGFSSSDAEHLPDWEISLETVRLTMKGDAPCSP